MNTQRITVPIEELSGGGGGSLQVERALTRVPGVVYAYVNPATEMAYIEYDPTRTGQSQLLQAVEQTGFRAGVPSLRRGDALSSLNRTSGILQR